jgi:drug/metabolite transporter (DMT)-like permease
MPSQSPRHPARGIFLFIFGLFLFACMDTTTKYLAVRYNVPLIAAVRYLVNCLLMAMLMGPIQGRKLVGTKRTGLVIIRGLSLAAVSVLAGLALQRMPVAEASAINFLSPLIVVLLAGPLLKEKTTAFTWFPAGIGLLGMLLIIRPGSGLDPVGVGFALCGICGAASYQMLSRVLVATETTIAMLFHTALVGSICFGLALPWTLHGPSLSLADALLFLTLGISSGIGHFIFTAAYREAPASTLAPLNYLQLVWAVLLGWLVFDHVPDLLASTGIAIIAGSGALVAFQSARARRTVPPEPLAPD